MNWIQRSKSRKQPHDAKTIRIPGSSDKGPDDDYGKWYKCWNCGFLCNIDRDPLGDVGNVGGLFNPTWINYTSSDYWTGTYGDYQGSRWTAEQYTSGGNKTGITLAVTGTWYSGYRPTYIKVAHDLGQDVSYLSTAELTDAGMSALHTDSLNDAVAVELTFSSDDISALTFTASGHVRPFHINAIWFLTPADTSKGCPYCGTKNWRGDGI